MSNVVTIPDGQLVVTIMNSKVLYSVSFGALKFRDLKSSFKGIIVCCYRTSVYHYDHMVEVVDFTLGLC